MIESQQRHLALWLTLNELKGFKPDIALEILYRFKKLDYVLDCSRSELNFIDSVLVTRIKAQHTRKRLAAIEYEISRALAEDLSIFPIISQGYPSKLKELPQPPRTVLVRGNVPNFDDIASVAIVGTRDPSPYGKDITYKIAKKLAGEGYAIISGLAFGVDAQAHIGALDAGGNTIAVLPSYVGDIVPKGNIAIAERILDCGGAIVSEYPPGVIPARRMFALRNRIIAALANSTIIIEGTSKSGTRHQATFVKELKRPLFVLDPPDDTIPVAELPLLLMDEGAQPLKDEYDALDAIKKTHIESSKQIKLKKRRKQVQLTLE